MASLKYFLSLVVGLLLFQGCATKSESVATSQNPSLHATGKAKVYIYSNSSLPANTVVKLDDVHVGSAASNGSFSVDTTPGEHTVVVGEGKPLSLHVDDKGSGYVRLDVVDGKVVSIGVAVSEGQQAVTALGGTK